MEAGATQLDPPTQDETDAGATVTNRMSFGQAWEIVKGQLTTDLVPEELGGEPATKRRKMEAQVIDIAMYNEGDAIVKWQVMIRYDNEKTGSGEVWADLDHQWANECEHMYELTKGWTDHMRKRTIEIDAPPQIQGDQKDRRPRHTIEFHSGGATQVSHLTNTRRTVRRVTITLGFDQGRVAHDPYNVHNMPYGVGGSTGRASSMEETAGGEVYYDEHMPNTQDRATSWADGRPGASHHHGQAE